MLSADDMSGKVLMQKVKYNGFDPELSEPFDVKNNLDPGRATMVVFPDTMYTGACLRIRKVRSCVL